MQLFCQGTPLPSVHTRQPARPLCVQKGRMCRLLGKACRAFGAWISRNRQIIGFLRASISRVRGTEVEKTSPEIEACRSPVVHELRMRGSVCPVSGNC